jgi:hypothetical protein
VPLTGVIADGTEDLPGILFALFLAVASLVSSIDSLTSGMSSSMSSLLLTETAVGGLFTGAEACEFTVKDEVEGFFKPKEGFLAPNEGLLPKLGFVPNSGFPAVEELGWPIPAGRDAFSSSSFDSSFSVISGCFSGYSAA